VSATNKPRVVIITRPTAYERLLQQHGTLGQARFFLERRGQSLEALETVHTQQEQALKTVEATIPADWRRGRVSRAELDRFLFEPQDLVVAVGQDGLVANVAKYLQGQSVIGINPCPERFPGVLVPHPPDMAGPLLLAAASRVATIQARMMVEARLDDGQKLLALNEVFVGHISHQSARYRLNWDGREERQSSSGLIVTSGTGSTGWARSIHQERHSKVRLPDPTELALAFFVREAWPSPTSGTMLTEGRIEGQDHLAVISEMDDGGVAFGDGIEADRIELLWGQRLEIGLAQTRLNLVLSA
jgi:NAD kinase